MKFEGHLELGKVIILLMLTITFSLAVYPASTVSTTEYQEQSTIQIRNRALSSENAINLREMAKEAQEAYVIVEVPYPVAEETYDAIKKRANIEGIIPPNMYIIKSNPKQLSVLQSTKLIKRAWRYSNAENKDSYLAEMANVKVRVITFETANKEEIIQQLSTYGTIEKSVENVIIMETLGQHITEIAQIEGIEWVEEEVQPVIFNDAAVVITGVRDEREDFDVYGAGETIAIADTGLDRGVNDGTMHNDFQGKILNIIDIASCTSCSTGPDDDRGHGTHVAGIALGNGVLSGSNPSSNSYDNSYAGVAPKAGLIFQAIGEDNPTSNAVYPPTSLIAGLFQPAYNQGARVHSDSWGNPVNQFGDYSSLSKTIDQFIWSNKSMNIVFAVGNSGSSGIATHAVAKNAISVGASENYKPLIADPAAMADNINQLYLGTGRGPTDDGRIKPDVVVPGTEIFSTRSRIAPGFPLGACTKNQSISTGNYNLGPDYSTCTGTSMATPHVAGMVAILREFYKTNVQFNITNPSSALIKATLINSAMDMGYGIPSNETGWGRVNISRVLPSSGNELFVKDVSLGVSSNKTQTCMISAIDSGVPVKVTLVWSDKEAAILAPKTLINDLNLIVYDPQNIEYNGNDFSMPFNDTIDNTNNVEQVIIPNPAPGIYNIKITGKNVPVPSQGYAIVMSYKVQPGVPSGKRFRCLNIRG